VVTRGVGFGVGVVVVPEGTDVDNTPGESVTALKVLVIAGNGSVIFCLFETTSNITIVEVLFIIN
jgi:hypothetical protein